MPVLLWKAHKPLGTAQPRLYLMNPFRRDFSCGKTFPAGKGYIPLPGVPFWVSVNQEGRDAPTLQWVVVGVLANLPKILVSL